MIIEKISPSVKFNCVVQTLWDANNNAGIMQRVGENFDTFSHSKTSKCY